MMNKQYPAEYSDKNGTEKTIIYDNGEILRMTIRGVTFEDLMFDSFEPVKETDPNLLQQFTIDRGELTSYQLE